MSPRLLSALASLTLVGASISSSEVLAPTAPTVTIDDDEPLHEAMEGLQSGLRSLRKTISPEAKDTAIATILEMQGYVITAFQHVPPVPEGAEAATNLTWGTDYKRRMLTLQLELVSMEELLLQGDIDGAKAAYKNLSALKKDGHDKYYPE